MSDFDFLKKDRLYQQYFRIASDAYSERISFFENHIEELDYLDVHFANEMRIDYVLSLFQSGKYKKYLRTVDGVIEVVIKDNIYTYKGGDIFLNLLRKKSACYLNIKQPHKALPIIRELIRIDPNNENNTYFFYLCNRRVSKGGEDVIKAVAIISLMCALSLKMAEVLVVNKHFAEYLTSFSTLTTTFFVIGSLLFLGNEVYRRWYIRNEIKRLQK